ncbi:MAG: LysR family transcriptional regulator [Acidimicrobiales bacterium]|nr:LysR family transcriptional regulator [Acidimicrobiales bacterium]
MDLRQLAALTAVADHRSFSGAARALHTVQSNVSTHIARLERELGASLVDRTSGGLTEAGSIVVDRARRVLHELDALTADVASSLGEVSGDVRLGVIGTTGRWLLPLVLDEVAATHPKVRVVTIDATTTSLVPQLASGSIDLAVVNLPVEDPDVDTEPLFVEEHVVVAPGSHKLARHEHLHLTDLADIPLLLEPVGTAFRDHLEIDADRAGVTLVAHAEVDGMRLLASLAHEGFGAAILPASATIEGTDGTTRSIPLDGTSPRGVGLATPRRARPSTPATAVAEIIRQVVVEEAPKRYGLRVIAPEAEPDVAD